MKFLGSKDKPRYTGSRVITMRVIARFHCTHITNCRAKGFGWPYWATFKMNSRYDTLFLISVFLGINWGQWWCYWWPRKKYRGSEVNGRLFWASFLLFVSVLLLVSGVWIWNNIYYWIGKLYNACHLKLRQLIEPKWTLQEKSFFWTHVFLESLKYWL